MNPYRIPYSSYTQPIVKEWNPVVPYNSQPLQANLVEFDCSRLFQTNVCDVMKGKYLRDNPLTQAAFPVSLAMTTAGISPLMGAIADNEKNLGTCILIAPNLILTARHVIEGMDIRNLSVTFGFTDYEKTENKSHSCRGVIETDAQYDYAIILLNDSLPLRGVKISKEPSSSELVLFHHPAGRPLKASVHASDNSDYESDYLTIYHDSEHVSSGGGYFDASDRLVAVHLGAQFYGDAYNPCKYAMTIKGMIAKNPDGILAQLEKGHAPILKNIYYELNLFERAFLVDEEGYESKKIFNREFLNKRTINKGATGVTFSKINFENMKTLNLRAFKNCLSKCLYINGVHGETKKYSVLSYIESDHTIPYSVWSATTNRKMEKYIKGGGTRPGENSLPAITIPYENHRDLLTTGSSIAATQFRHKLTNKCNGTHIDRALAGCFKEYRANQVRSDRPIVKESIIVHKSLDVLTNNEALNVLRILRI